MKINIAIMAAVIVLICNSIVWADSTLKVITVDKTTPLKNIRIECGNQRVRTDENGEFTFILNPGKYTVEGPDSKVEGWVFKDAETVAVLQVADLKLNINQYDLGRYPYEGKTYSLDVSYETPFNYEAKLTAINVPKDWKVEYDKESVRPDSKCRVSVIIPQDSTAETETMQFLAQYKDQVIAATPPLKVLRGWKHKPQDVSKDIVKEMLPIQIDLQTTRKFDKEGTTLDTDVDLNMKNNIGRKLIGQANVRFTHEWAPQDNADSIDFRLANLTYVTGIFNLTLGRFDLAPLIRPGEFFGSYLTMGQRRFDGVFFFLPVTIYGSAGVDAQGFSLPPAAISVTYFPNYFSMYPEIKDYENGYILSELKLPIMLFDNPLMIAINHATTTTYSYLWYSPLSGDQALSASWEYTYSRNYRIYGEFAIANVSAVSDTTALMTGASAKNLRNYTYGILDEIAVEYQIPLISSESNPFAGGNTFVPDESEKQQGAWYVRLKSSYDYLEFAFAITNSVGDFTFARPANSALDPNRNFNLNDLRSANEVENLGKTLLSASYNDISFLFSIKARF